jgi:hypothetical protein
MKDSILLYLEWELLDEPIAITQVEDRTELPVGKRRSW